MIALILRFRFGQLPPRRLGPDRDERGLPTAATPPA
jgi:hypothetical protein